jgi:hypothetical protein
MILNAKEYDYINSIEQAKAVDEVNTLGKMSGLYLTQISSITTSTKQTQILNKSIQALTIRIDELLNKGAFYSSAVFGTTAYATGGLNTSTGPAWLDGTASKPEYVLNAEQTSRFFELVDVLGSMDIKKQTKQANGDNYFDIQINVDNIEDDYDVEQLANKIKSMIYDDATYRNTNVINYIR